MAISLTAEAIILAINSAIKLGKNLQRAYAKSAKSKAIFLPLPKFDVRPNADRAHRFFRDKTELKGGHQFVAQVERLTFLFQQFDNGLLLEQQEEYVNYYETLSFQLRKDRERDVNHDGVNTDDLVALLRVKQWEDGSQARNTPLKMVAGTIVEIGIDYFNQVPGALNVNSTFGKTMRHFLTGLDRVEFSETEELRDLSKIVVPRLFIAAAESVKDLSEDITKDEKLQAFIEATTAGIARDVFKFSKNKDDEVPLQWGQLLLRSMVKNAGHYVFKAPGLVFNTNEGVSGIIEKTGGVLMDIILKDPHQLNLQSGFNIEALDRLLKSTFEVIAIHPELISKRHGIREIVMGVSKAMAEADFHHRPDLLPELVRLILEHTADNLSTVLGRPNAGPRYLLVEAIREFLWVISKHQTPGPWKPRFSKRHILAIANHLLDEVVLNPAWVLAEVEGDKLLRKALQVSFDALSKIPVEERLNLEVLELLIQLNIQTVATSQAVLEKVPWGNATEKVVILEKALDLVFAFVFDKNKVAPAQRVEWLVDLLEYVLEVLIREYPDERCLVLVDLILFKDPNLKYGGGFNADLADALVESGLQVLNKYPQLVTESLPLKNIIVGISGALQAKAWKQAGLLPELARLTLSYTAQNLRLLIPSQTGEPRYLLVEALKLLLEAIAEVESNGEPPLSLTAAELLEIIEELLDVMVEHPAALLTKVRGGSIYETVLQATFEALARVPKEQRLKERTMAGLLPIVLRTAAIHPSILAEIEWGKTEDKIVLLNKVLDLILLYVFSSDQDEAGRLALLEDLVYYVLDTLIAEHPDKTILLLLYLILFEDENMMKRGKWDEDRMNDLVEAALKVIEAYPELISKDLVFQKVVRDTAHALKVSKLEAPELFPEMIRLVLLHSADHVEMITNVKPTGSRYILAVALEECLRAIAARPKRGKWKPTLSIEQMTEIAALVLEAVANNPQWISREKWIQLLLRIIFQALEVIPKDQGLTYEALRRLIQASIEAVSFRKQLLIHVIMKDGSKKQLVLSYALSGLFIKLYDPANQSAGTWTLTQSEVITAVIDLFLLRLSNVPANQEEVDKALQVIAEAIDKLNQNLAFSLEELEEALTVEPVGSTL